MSTLRKCKQCGKTFRGNPDSLYCRDCAKERKKIMIRTRVCQDCGRSFEGMPRSSRCPECSYKKLLLEKKDITRHRVKGRWVPLIVVCCVEKNIS